MTIRNVFVSSKDGRLRAGWRIVFFLVLYYALTFLLLLPAIQWIDFDPLNLSPRSLLIGGLINAVSTTIAVWGARRGIDRKSVESLGFLQEHLWRDLLAGIGIAGGMMAVIFMGMSAAGWLQFEGVAWGTSAGSTWLLDIVNIALLFLLVGITEEMQFRGYILQNIEEGSNVFWAYLLSAAFFAFLHLANPGALQTAPMIGLFLAGLFFAFAYYRTRSLWLAVGLHIGWNLFENTVFGFNVSGLAIPGLLQHSITGPVLWTGGGFGPEAGLILVPGLLAGLALVIFYTRNR